MTRNHGYFYCIGHPVTRLSGGGSLVGVAVNSHVMRRDVETQVALDPRKCGMFALRISGDKQRYIASEHAHRVSTTRQHTG